VDETDGARAWMERLGAAGLVYDDEEDEWEDNTDDEDEFEEGEGEGVCVCVCVCLWCMNRDGQSHICTVYFWYFWQGNHRIYSVYIRFWPTL